MNLSEQMRKNPNICFLYALFLKGYSTQKDITEFMQTYGHNYRKYKKILDFLIERNLVERYEPKIKIRARKTYYIIPTKEFKSWYENKFKTKAVESNLEKIIKQHSSIEHGYMINLTSSYFKKMNFKVLEKHEETRTKIEGIVVEPDLILDFGDYRQYVEVETGKANKDYLYEKLNKYKYITGNVIFVVPNKDVETRYRNVIEFWSNNFDINKKLEVTILNLSIILQAGKKKRKIK